jgi:cell wall-associated NlpC family hydrolase
MKRQTLPQVQRSTLEILLPDGRRISTVYKADFPGGQGPVLLTQRSVWWGTKDMVFRADLSTGKREVYLPWAGGKGAVQALEIDGDSVRVRTDAREAKIRPDSEVFDGYVRLRLGEDQLVPPPGVCQKIAQTVEEWLGVPYLYGGNTKSGCDCSGFVGAMLRVAGKSLPRTIAQSGKPVLGELRFGDVVCSPGHVALYLGNGWQAEAPKTGDVVKKTTVWHRASATARRFL